MEKVSWPLINIVSDTSEYEIITVSVQTVYQIFGLNCGLFSWLMIEQFTFTMQLSQTFRILQINFCLVFLSLVTYDPLLYQKRYLLYSKHKWNLCWAFKLFVFLHMLFQHCNHFLICAATLDTDLSPNLFLLVTQYSITLVL